MPTLTAPSAEKRTDTMNLRRTRISANRRLSLISRRPRRRTARAAFTLLELLLVLAILVVLGGIVVVNVIDTQSGATADATRTQVKMVQQGITMYQLRIGSVPETLESLRDGPSDAGKKAKWTGPILDEIPKDGWGNEFNYTVNGNGYEIRSGGIDQQMSTDDDIVVTK